MVDVGGKAPSDRRALARARVVFPEGLRARALAGQGPKGALVEVARVAGIQAAKRTSALIPMCHPLPLEHVSIELVEVGQDALDVRCAVRCHARTGAEMEALVGATIAALTVYDMSKALGRGIRLESVELLAKSGGKSGPWQLPAAGPLPPAGTS